MSTLYMPLLPRCQCMYLSFIMDSSKNFSPQTILFQLVPFIIMMLTEARRQLRFLLRYGGHYIHADDHEGQYNRICSEHIDGIVRSFFIKMGIIYISLVVETVTVLIYIRRGTRTTLTDLKFPFVVEKSDTEFYLNAFIQAAVVLLGGLAYVSIEVVMGLAHDVASISPKITNYELEKFREMMKDEKLTKAKKYETFKDIVKQALSSDKYDIVLRSKNCECVNRISFFSSVT